MSKAEHKKEITEQDEGVNLKGTLYSVSAVGVVIILSWVGVWALFLSR